MKRYFRTVDEVMRSPWGTPVSAAPKSEASDRVLRSTKLDDTIYLDMRMGDDTLDKIELDAEKKLRSEPGVTTPEIWSDRKSMLSFWNWSSPAKC